MTDRLELQKRQEENWARLAARELNVDWKLKRFERPDFSVLCNGLEFGLEVTECHIGILGRKGSSWRATEIHNRKLLDRARRDYESETGLILRLDYLGDATVKSMNELVAALLNAPLETLEVTDPKIEIHLSSAKVFVGRAINHQWVFVKDCVGWVSRDGSLLQKVVDKKSEKLATYRESFRDVRLLVVSNRTSNSGKLKLESSYPLSLKGFDVVYFFSYPEKLIAYNGS
ncbi:hypothetical protein [Maritimibacter alkaliphilus]|uniref:hypothetical protein n=1 Tax=Maritimibacter alkaliphilus TaxID=404236 RepID=UPI001C947273|nr:hypothetical protein [Maritimibacter alkaliphilus]MBY6089508.1 hypothetical protein [Maritimibacter alkaliphilus]